MIAIVGTYLMIAYVLLIFGYYVSVVIPLVTCCGIYSLVRGPFLRQELERTRSKRTKRGLIFVAYSRKDEEFVLELADRLQKRKLNVWVDQLRLPGGVDWEQQTRKALERCEKFLIILSPASVKS
ncbi:toll/interleukin-1 receptor domain-containing protein, partial [candidate division KSB1 bacterium]|nr:toll/interleukin-1 receptor domain-containing protein [candidate division KSB1 bacterium]NIT69532.1 toll/interleukin-1 receptor domain-containing protein [candidate division KSB1 bacterium]NIV92361.1 TIR domain-containing protein [candidate division KSB1 bacterium]NIX69213.1 TIR domain-containing protein [candidate division KSB1 bacterium]